MSLPPLLLSDASKRSLTLSCEPSPVARGHYLVIPTDLRSRIDMNDKLEYTDIELHTALHIPTNRSTILLHLADPLSCRLDNSRGIIQD
jgi:hypothetical protein